MASDLPPTPECDKAHAVMDESRAIGHFLDWLSSQKIYLSHVAYDHENDREIELSGPGCSYEQLLARYFEIDLAKMSLEKDAILRHIRKQQEASA